MRLNYISSVCALVALVLSLRSSLAITGNDLSALCSNEKKLEYCLGYVMGADDALSRFACPAPDRTASQTVKIIGKFLSDNPTRLNERASDLILEAFITACRK